MRQWLRFRDRIVDTLDPRFHPEGWLDWAVANGTVKCFYGAESVLLAEIKTYPGGAKVGGVFHALGDIDELENEIRPRAEQWARENGCVEIILEGRQGWVRRLKKHGYRHEKTTVVKGL